MVNFNKINTIVGWVVCIIAAFTYISTVEPTASFWDCGEFIAVSYKLEVPHPPGAPLFLLIGRIFSFFAAGDVTRVAFWVNMVSVMSSVFSILFLFWTITLLARKFLNKTAQQLSKGEGWAVIGAGVVGALAYTFSDSFWFSSEEAEVYAMSSFFTAFMLWSVFKWELIEDEAKANRWLILMAYMIGLSIGVHLLNLVILPVLGLVYYFKRYSKHTWKGALLTVGITGVILIFIMSGIITGVPSLAGAMEIFFVNTVGLPFGSGIIIFLLLFFGGLAYGIWYSIRRNKALLNTALLSFAFIIIGYLSYGIIIVRSNFNPPIDENNPQNAISFLSYLKREQYGDRPLFYGPYFTSKIEDQVKTSALYRKGDKKYEVYDYKVKPVYESGSQVLFPRVWSTQPEHKERYRKILNLRPDEKPTMGDNLYFFFSHQLGHMYFRYFMWNFVGRESDEQDAGWLLPLDSSKDLPRALAENKARNNFYMLPLIVGLMGLFFQYSRNRKWWGVVALAFFMTGAALVMYLNSGPIEPRERDYIYVGSFYIFAIWIGFGVLFIYYALEKLLKKETTRAVIASAFCLIVPGVMVVQGWDDHDRSGRYFSVDSAKNMLSACPPNAILFTGGDNDTFPLWYVQEVEGFRTDVRVIVLTYLNTDWYIDQLKMQMNKSQPLPISLPSESYKAGSYEYIPYQDVGLKGGMDLNQYMDLVRKKHPLLQVELVSGGKTVILPSKEFFLKINKADVLSTETVGKNDAHLITDTMRWAVRDNHIEKNDLIILDVLNSNKWQRPICFNFTSRMSCNLDFSNYLREEGLVYRLVPVEVKDAEYALNVEAMYTNFMTKFSYRGMNNPSIYSAEEYSRFALAHRDLALRLASFLYYKGDNERSKKVLLKMLDVFRDKGTYEEQTIYMLTARLLLKLNEESKADKVVVQLVSDLQGYLDFYLKGGKLSSGIIEHCLGILNQVSMIYEEVGKKDKAEQYSKLFNRYYEKITGDLPTK